MRNFKLLSVLLLCMAVVFTSCGTWNNTAKGTAIGVGGGAAAGAGEAGPVITFLPGMTFALVIAR